MANAKNPTYWQTPSRQGYITNIGNAFLVDNKGNFITNNTTTKSFLITTPNQTTPPNATAWTATAAS